MVTLISVRALTLRLSGTDPLFTGQFLPIHSVQNVAQFVKPLLGTPAPLHSHHALLLTELDGRTWR